MKLSVIVPVYNMVAGGKLENCLNSLVNQDVEDMEIIAVDDGSTDKTLDILRTFEKEHKNIKVIHTENFGVCHARNLGIDNASGDFITFIDADDTLKPFALESLLDLISKYNADISAMSRIYLNEDGSVKVARQDIGVIEIWEGITPLLKHSQDHIAGHSVGEKLFRKELIKDIRFEEGKKVNEDSFFSFECFSKAQRVVFSDVAIYEYYNTETSSSKNGFSDKYLDILYFAEKKAEIIRRSFPLLEKYIPSIIIRANISILLNLCQTYKEKYKALEKECIKTIKNSLKEFIPTTKLEKRFTFIIKHNLFSFYKLYSYLKHYR